MIFAELRLKYGPPAIGFSAIARSVMIFAKALLLTMRFLVIVSVL